MLSTKINGEEKHSMKSGVVRQLGVSIVSNKF